ncbi:MAG: hypothetical protein M1837_007539 [Sclerophora amabilis]|nr:MAG: hypothetical protein M1837_007539 [Sclerophora amabilis]
MMATASPTAPPKHRSKASFSFMNPKSHKSHKRNASLGKMNHQEKVEESHKAKTKMTTKADPTLAINEAQPADVAAGQGRLSSLRSIEHRDSTGNVIVEPDRSNPTRNRWERPLDTIRSFEAAVDGSHNRKSIARNDSTDALGGFASQRTSYYQGNVNSNQNSPSYGRYPQDGGYYGPRSGASRPESYVDGHGGAYMYNRPRQVHPAHRMVPEPHYNGYGGGSPNFYPTQGPPAPYDAATTGSGSNSHGTDRWGNSTEPSSENSSIDRLQQAPKPDVGENYGFTGFGGAPPPPLHDNGYGDPAQGYPPNNYQGHGGTRAPQPVQTLPPVPPKDNTPPARTRIKLGSSAINVAQTSPPAQGARPGAGEKRKSWFKRLGKA